MLKTAVLFCFAFLITHQQPWFNNQVFQFRGKYGIFQPLIQPTIKSYYGCGAQIQFQDNQGNGDDTAANGLRITFCDPIDWKMQQTKQFAGQFGSWKGMKMCPEGSYIIGFRVRNEQIDNSKKDNSALNGLRIACRNPYTFFNNMDYLTIEVTVYEGLWGDWQSQGNWFLGIQRKYKYMNGFSTQYSKYYKNEDSTAMNGLTFQVEEFKFPNQNMKLKQMCYSPMEWGPPLPQEPWSYSGE